MSLGDLNLSEIFGKPQKPAAEAAAAEDAPVTPDMLVSQIIAAHPAAADFLIQDCGMGCIYCPSSQMETLAQAAMVHGLDGEDVCAALNDYLIDAAMIKAEEL
jgi:hybrid cluster-associated redox disulfide protein